jgi:hypothetical protein
MDGSHVSRLLSQGIAAARAKQRRRAREYLLKVIALDEGNEQAWLWLSGVMDALEDQKICLENVLAINSGQRRAFAGFLSSMSFLWGAEFGYHSHMPPLWAESAGRLSWLRRLR